MRKIRRSWRERIRQGFLRHPRSSGNGRAAIICCKMEEKDRKTILLEKKYLKDLEK